MDRFYVFQCDKCGEYIDISFVEANNKKEAELLMDDAIHEHELTYHGADGEWPKGRIVCLVPFKRRSK